MAETLRRTSWAAVLVTALAGLPAEARAAVDDECLAIEQAFAENRIADLALLEPTIPRWHALKTFRLAAAYIPERRHREARRLLKRGLNDIADALRDRPDDVELLLLGAMMDGQILLIDRWRFLFNGFRGLRRLAQAERLAPDNPRAALIRGTAKVVVPWVLGGSARQAIEILSGGVRDTSLCDAGEWAQVDILNWLGRAYDKIGDTETATCYYRQALARSENNHWVQLAIAGEGYRWIDDDAQAGEPTEAEPPKGLPPADCVPPAE